MKTAFALCLCYTLTTPAQAQQSTKEILVTKLNTILKKFEGKSFSDGETVYTVKTQRFTSSGFLMVIDMKEIKQGTVTKLKAECRAIPWVSFSSFEAESSEADKEVQEIRAEFKQNLHLQAVLNGNETYYDKTNTMTLYTTQKDFKEISSVVSEIKKLGK